MDVEVVSTRRNTKESDTNVEGSEADVAKVVGKKSRTAEEQADDKAEPPKAKRSRKRRM